MEPIGISKIRYHTTTGVILEITPITLMIHAGLKDQSEKLFPDPDPSPFEVEMVDALIPGDKTRASDNPEYNALMERATAQRTAWIKNRIYEHFVTSPNRSELLFEYGPQIESVRGLLFDESDDSWLILLLAFILQPADQNLVTLAALQRLPITDSEVSGAFKFFRLMALSRGENRGRSEVEVSPPTEGTPVGGNGPTPDGNRDG